MGPTTSDLDLSGADAKRVAEDAGDYGGYALAHGGDMNDDGEPDILIGSTSAADGGVTTSGTA